MVWVALGWTIKVRWSVPAVLDTDDVVDADELDAEVSV